MKKTNKQANKATATHTATTAPRAATKTQTATAKTARRVNVIIPTPQGKHCSIKVLVPQEWTEKTTCQLNGTNRHILPQYAVLFDSKGTLELHRITNYNVQEYGKRIAIRAIKTILDKTALTAKIATPPKKVESPQNRKNTIYAKANATTKGQKATAMRLANESEKMQAQATQATFDKAIANESTQQNNGYFEFIHKLYYGLIKDINHKPPQPNAKESDSHVYSDGMDIVQECICFLLDYIGQPLESASKVLDKQGQAITIKTACFRHINRYIMQHRSRVYKTTALLDNGQYITPPTLWDTPTITDLNILQTLITKMNLSSMEKRILNLRLQGYGLEKIGVKLSITKGTAQTYTKRIQAKATKIGLTPQTSMILMQAIANDNQATAVDILLRVLTS